MKRNYIGVLLALALFLAACTEGEVSDFTFETNHTANGEFIICDDDRTNLEYEFTYTSSLIDTLDSWTQRLVGVEDDRVAFERTYVPSDSEVTFLDTNTYRVNTVIPPRTAPLSVDGQAIIVEPVVRGQSILEIEIEGTLGTTQTFRSRPIDIVDCF